MVDDEGEKYANQCEQCECKKWKVDDFSMAFQPIYDVARGEIFAYEALVRGNHNDPALPEPNLKYMGLI